MKSDWEWETEDSDQKSWLVGHNIIDRVFR